MSPEAALLFGQKSRVGGQTHTGQIGHGSRFGQAGQHPHGDDRETQEAQHSSGREAQTGQRAHGEREVQHARAREAQPQQRAHAGQAVHGEPAKRRPLTIKQVEYFVAAVECGSLTAAAEEKDITVQGISQAVADLEREIGTLLLERGRQGTAPTAFGFECYARAKSLLLHFNEFDMFLRSQKRSPR